MAIMLILMAFGFLDKLLLFKKIPVINTGISFFIPSGWLQPNHVDKVWYYCDATGAMRTGWVTVELVAPEPNTVIPLL